MKEYSKEILELKENLKYKAFFEKSICEIKHKYEPLYDERYTQTLTEPEDIANYKFQKQMLDKQIGMLQASIDETNQNFRLLTEVCDNEEYAEMINDNFANNKKWNVIAEKHYLSSRTLSRITADCFDKYTLAKRRERDNEKKLN